MGGARGQALGSARPGGARGGGRGGARGARIRVGTAQAGLSGNLGFRGLGVSQPQLAAKVDRN